MLVERYQGRAYRLALRVLRDEEAARDAVQEAFVKAYTALARFEGRSSFFTWLYRLVMNQCLDARRRDKSGREVAYEEGGGQELVPEASLELVPEVDGVSFAPAAHADAQGAARAPGARHRAAAAGRARDAAAARGRRPLLRRDRRARSAFRRAR